MRGKKGETSQPKEKVSRAEAIYRKRFDRHLDELRWLYMELYDNGSMFAELCDNLHRFNEERANDLKKLDREREKAPDWYKKNDMLGMMLLSVSIISRSSGTAWAASTALRAFL